MALLHRGPDASGPAQDSATAPACPGEADAENIKDATALDADDVHIALLCDGSHILASASAPEAAHRMFCWRVSALRSGGQSRCWSPPSGRGRPSNPACRTGGC
eukprot:10471105-Alexandrium_andersonii.AAC.1